MISWHAPENSHLCLHFFTYIPGSTGLLGIHQVNSVMLVALGITIVFVLLSMYAGHCSMTNSLLKTTDGDLSGMPALEAMRQPFKTWMVSLVLMVALTSLGSTL